MSVKSGEDQDFNRAHSTLKIERNATHGAISTPKTDRSTRTVSVPAFLATEIAAHIDAQKVAALDGTDWLLPNKRGCPQYHNVDRWWHRVREDLANRLTDPARAQLLRTKLDIHCLRHTFSTVAQELAAAQATIQQQLGHASATMTRQYTHPSLDSQRAAVALFPTPNRRVTAASTSRPKL